MTKLINISSYIWRGYWPGEVKKTSRGTCHFTEKGITYYSYWLDRYGYPIPDENTEFESFLLDFLLVIKLKESN